MTKKSILIGTFAAWLLIPQTLHAPGLDNRINGIPESQVREYTKQRTILDEEIELLKNDEIYRIIDSIYERMDVPNYITKKFVRTLIKVESDDNPRDVSSAGARGLGQIMRGTWYKIEKDDYLKNVFIPERNINTAIKHLVGINEFCRANHPNWGKLSYTEKIDLISAAYNGGTGKLQKENWKIDRMFRETREYVPKIHKISKKFIPSAEIYEPTLTGISRFLF